MLFFYYLRFIVSLNVCDFIEYVCLLPLLFVLIVWYLNVYMNCLWKNNMIRAKIIFRSVFENCIILMSVALICCTNKAVLKTQCTIFYLRVFYVLIIIQCCLLSRMANTSGWKNLLQLFMVICSFEIYFCACSEKPIFHKLHIFATV